MRVDLRRLVRVTVLTTLTIVAAPNSLPAQQADPTFVTQARTRLALADSAYEAGARTLAERRYRDVLQADPENSRAVYQLGQLAHDDREAVRLFRRYTQLEPRDAWGYIALAEALARTARMDEALRVYDHAARLAPGERDVEIGRARMLARAGRTRRAITVYETWLAAHPDDAVVRTRLRALRTSAAPWVQPAVRGTVDSDGNHIARAGLTAGALVGADIGLRAEATAARVSDGVLASSVHDALVGASWRPRHAVRIETRGGLTGRSTSAAVTSGPPGVCRPPSGPPVPCTPVMTAPAPRVNDVVPTGELRVEWRHPDVATLAFRAGRTVVVASPLLVQNQVVRDEIGGRADITLAGPLRLRALGRTTRISAVDDRNGRTLVGAGAVLAGARGELSATVQRLRYDHPTTSGYFAPQAANIAEVGTYVERESDSGLRVALDLGVGAQQVTDWGAAPGSWSPAYRAWSELALPVATGRELRLELEAYDSRIGEIAGTGHWRYLSVSLGLHWVLE